MSNTQPPPSMSEAQPTLVGETVTISYVADPSVGHGRFLLENPGPKPISGAVDAAWFVAGEDRRPLSVSSVYDVDGERALEPDDLNVEPRSALTMLVGFPAFPYEPGFGETSAVELSVRVDGVTLDASSPLKFVRRWPRSSP